MDFRGQIRDIQGGGGGGVCGGVWGRVCTCAHVFL